MRKLLLSLLFLSAFTTHAQVPDIYMCDQNHDETEVFFIGGQTPIIISNQPAGNYTVSYHASLANAEANANPLPLTVEVHGLQMVVYSRVENTDTHNFGIDMFRLIIAPVPNPQLPPQAPICPQGSYVLDTQLPADFVFTFTWSYNNQVIIGADSNTFEADYPGTYSVTVSYGSGLCSATATTIVTESAPPTGVTTIVNGETITVLTGGLGFYEYSIDGGAYQASPVFLNVSPGEHVITVRDMFGCGSTSFSVLGVDKNNFAAFSCAPNPVHDFVKIANSQLIDKITATNALGAIIFEKSGHETTATLDFSNLNTGLYILKVESGNQQKIIKVLKE